MLRARRTADASQAAAGVSRPGIDPRRWLALANVVELGFDPLEGCFADLSILPTGEPETAYYGSSYAGALFGDHCPIEVGDTVVVGWPGGESGDGPVIICRFNNAADPPHPDFGAGAEPSTARVVRVKPNEKLILRTSGTGAVSVVVEGTADVEITSIGGIVQLGATIPGTPALSPVSLALQVDLNFTQLHAAILAALGAVTVPGGGPAAVSAFNLALAAPPWVPLVPSTAAAKVRAT